MRRVKDILLGAGLFLVACAFTLTLGVRDMDRQTKQVWQWLLIVALLIGIVRIVGGQNIVYRDTLLVNGKPVMGEAYVDCDSIGVPTIYTTKAMTLTVWWPELVVHEKTHLAQMAVSGLPCQEYMRRYRADPALRLKIESEAYCAGLRSVYDDHWQNQTAGVVENLYNGYVLGMNRVYIDSVFTLTCKEASHAKQRPLESPP